MVLYEASHQHIELYTAHNVLVSQWYGGCSSAEYRESLKRFLHFIETLQVHYAITDRRLLPPLAEEDALWTSEVFLEHFRRLPLRRFAIIRSFSLSAGKQLHHFIHNKERPLPFEAKVFEDLTSAYDWLTASEAV